MWFDLRLLGAAMQTAAGLRSLPGLEGVDVRRFRHHVFNGGAAVRGARNEGLCQRLFSSEAGVADPGRRQHSGLSLDHRPPDNRSGARIGPASPLDAAQGGRAVVGAVVLCRRGRAVCSRITCREILVWEIASTICELDRRKRTWQWLGQSPTRIACCLSCTCSGLTLLLGTTIVLSIRLVDFGLRAAALRSCLATSAISHSWPCTDADQRVLDFYRRRGQLFRRPVVPAEDGAAAHRSNLQL